jgi:formylglycine-generating enzyme required for sulfatase activity
MIWGNLRFFGILLIVLVCSAAPARLFAQVTGTGAANPVVSGQAGEEVVFNLPGGVTLAMVKIPRGSFLMGSTQSEVDAGWADSNELPQHTVNIAYDYYMGKFEVTQRQWQAVMGNNPSGFSPVNPQGLANITLDNPVESVSWNDIQVFESAINALGLGGAFRLPSEAEWEYAARGGTQTRFHFGDSTCPPSGRTTCDLSQYEWWYGNHISITTVHHPVGLKPPNAYGLYDTGGNVLEWVEDRWDSWYSGAPSDGSPRVSPSGLYQVLRGGRWSDSPERCRPAARWNSSPTSWSTGYGFRLAWTP